MLGLRGDWFPGRRREPSLVEIGAEARICLAQ